MTAHAHPSAPQCLAPKPTRAPLEVKTPAGAWDTHAHVISDGIRPPYVAQRNYTPHATPADEFIRMMDILGIDYGVLIQISVHGTDNRLILDALKRYPHRLCGVGAIDGTESDEELEKLKQAGLRGVRLNDLFSGSAGTGRLHTIAEKCRQMGWHLDLALHGQRLRELAPALAQLDIPLVIDHMGWCPVQDGVGGEEFQAVLDLAQRENCWVKLSGAYRISTQPPPYEDVKPFVRALIEVAPTRTIWGSDWPHVAIHDPASMPEPGMLLDVLHYHLANSDELHKVLVENPLKLYGRPGDAPPYQPD